VKRQRAKQETADFAEKLLSSSPIPLNFSVDEETALTERRHHTIVL
jgi:hypothetical protein